MAHYNVPKGVRINFYRGNKPLSTLPQPGLAFIPDSLLAGYQGSRLAEVYVGIIFFRCRALV